MQRLNILHLILFSVYCILLLIFNQLMKQLSPKQHKLWTRIQ